MRTLELVLVLALAVATADGRPDACQFGIYAGEGTSALVCGIGLGIGLGALAHRASGGGQAFFSISSVPGLVGLGVGYSTGAGIGAWAVGTVARQHGRLPAALLGGLCGTAAWAGMTAVAYGLNLQPPTTLLVVTALTLTPLGAVVGYNASRPRTPGRAGVLVEPPGLGLRSDQGPGRTPVAVTDLRLVTVRF